MDNFWENEDQEVFRDIPDEVQLDNNGNQLIAPPVNVRTPQRSIAQSVPIQQPIAVELQHGEHQEEHQEEDEDFSIVLNDARLRLEQGRLYEMIMNHDIFAGSDADEKAVKHVQRQIRNFAKEQMEIMLGMRQEQSKDISFNMNFPFNPLEIETLKALASAATKGATKSAAAEQYIAPVKKIGLNPIGVNRQTKTTAKLTPKIANPLPNQPTNPVKRSKSDTAIDQILREEGVTREELNAVFDPNYKTLNKPLHELTEQELLERNKQAKRRITGQVKSPNALPMPSVEQEEMIYTQRAAVAAANPQMQNIMSLLTNPKKK